MQQRTDRIRSLASRSRFRIGGLLVQPDRLIVAIDGRDIALEPRIMEVLVALAEQAGETISADQLLIDIWGGSFYGDNPVHRAIALLRKLIGDDSRAPRYVETIRKRGYRLIAPVSFPDDYRGSASQVSAWANGNPYVGLVPFDGDHAGVPKSVTIHPDDGYTINGICAVPPRISYLQYCIQAVRPMPRTHRRRATGCVYRTAMPIPVMPARRGW